MQKKVKKAEKMIEDMTKEISPKAVLMLMTSVFGIGGIDIKKVIEEERVTDCLVHCHNLATSALLYLKQEGFDIDKAEKSIKKACDITEEALQEIFGGMIDNALKSIGTNINQQTMH